MQKITSISSSMFAAFTALASVMPLSFASAEPADGLSALVQACVAEAQDHHGVGNGYLQPTIFQLRQHEERMIKICNQWLTVDSSEIAALENACDHEAGVFAKDYHHGRNYALPHKRRQIKRCSALAEFARRR